MRAQILSSTSSIARSRSVLSSSPVAAAPELAPSPTPSKDPPCEPSRFRTACSSALLLATSVDALAVVEPSDEVDGFAGGAKGARTASSVARSSAQRLSVAQGKMVATTVTHQGSGGEGGQSCDIVR
jgi:hypothetical protein